MQTPFRELYGTLSEDKLRSILLERADYVRDAVRAAEWELTSRGIEEEELASLIEEGMRRQKIHRELASEPLSWEHKTLYFVFCFLLFTPFVWYFYNYHSDKGYDRKAAESMQFVFLGLLTYAAIGSVLYRMGIFAFSIPTF